MRHLRQEELEGLLPDRTHEWRNPEVKFHASGRPVHEPYYATKKLIKCLKCNSHFLFTECDNCGADESLGKAFVAASEGLACVRCDQHFTHWTCPECGCNNPVMRTWLVPKQKVPTTQKCFIATAVYGSYCCQEVETLRAFRDTVLLSRPLGRWLVRLYYRNSPPLAEFLQRHRIARILVRQSILDPFVRILGHSDSLDSTSKEFR